MEILKPEQAGLMKKVFYKKGILVDYIYHNCEISYDKHGFYVSLFAVEENSKAMTLHLPKGDETEEIMKYFKYNFDKLAHSLVIQNGKIMIKSAKNDEIIFGDQSSYFDFEKDYTPIPHFQSL